MNNKVFARNLRCFFGADATSVWSLCRDQERAKRSVELYKRVLAQLEEDLEQEKGKRGTLVRVRSNEVTGIKEKLN